MQRLLLTGFLRFFPAFLRVFGSILELLADDLRRVLRLIGEFLWRFAGLVSRYIGFAIDFLRIVTGFGARASPRRKHQSSGTSGDTKSRQRASIVLGAIRLAGFRKPVDRAKLAAGE
jgi:hypothetical protein